MRRALAWVVVTPLLGAGILAAHDAAYRLTGTPSEGVHAYLGHAPQVLLLACMLCFAVLPISGREARLSPWAFVASAGAVFAAQEHLERVAHGGSVPWLLASPVFLLGLALQVPFALVAWAAARWLLRTAAGNRPRRRPRVSSILLSVPLGANRPRAFAVARADARAPPALRVR